MVKYFRGSCRLLCWSWRTTEGIGGLTGFLCGLCLRFVWSFGRTNAVGGVDMAP